MKLKWWLGAGLIGTFLICGYSRHVVSRERQRWISGYMAEIDAQGARMDFAERIMLHQVTNDIVGIRSVFGVVTATEDFDTNKWWGMVTVEYINHLGGVERTNLQYRFFVDMAYPAGVFCSMTNSLVK